jgi:predicted MPP superfamily phosphohydrolase
MLARLPKLGLSFGPVRPPLFMLNLIRLTAYLAAFSETAISGAAWQRITILVGVGLFQLFFLAATFDGLYIEPFHLTVSELEIKNAPIFFQDRPLRILQVSDLHIEHISPRERAVMEKVNSLAADMIVLTGDYINKSYLKDIETLREARGLLSQLRAPFGVYAINGNMDRPPIMNQLFNGLDNVRVLDDEINPIAFPESTLYLIGMTTTGRRQDFSIIKSLMANVPEDAYSILLSHYPKGVELASEAGVDVYLAGDTHGGQARLPWIGTITTTRLGNSYIMGEYQVGPTTLFVSRGLGMQGGIWPRIRFNCPPEIVLVKLGK